MYWRLKSIPELRDLSPSRRRELWRRALRDPLRSGDVVRLFVIVATILALVLLRERAEDVISTRWARFVVSFVVFLLAYCVFLAITAQRLRSVLHELRQSDD